MGDVSLGIMSLFHLPGHKTTVRTALTISIPSEADGRKRQRYAKRDIGGIGIAVVSRSSAIGELNEAIVEGGHVKLAFCNANLVNVAADDAALQRSLATFLVLADALVMAVAVLLGTAQASGDKTGLASVIVGGVFAAVGAFLVRSGAGDITPMNLKPDRTAMQVRRDRDLARDQMR